jgi:hypothetical protein
MIDGFSNRQTSCSCQKREVVAAVIWIFAGYNLLVTLALIWLVRYTRVQAVDTLKVCNRVLERLERLAAGKADK